MVHKFVNDVYLGLCSNEFLLDINLELATVLGMLSPDDETVLEQFQETVIESEDMNMVRKKKKYSDHLNTGVVRPFCLVGSKHIKDAA